MTSARITRAPGLSTGRGRIPPRAAVDDADDFEVDDEVEALMTAAVKEPMRGVTRTSPAARGAAAVSRAPHLATTTYDTSPKPPSMSPHSRPLTSSSAAASWSPPSLANGGGGHDPGSAPRHRRPLRRRRRHPSRTRRPPRPARLRCRVARRHEAKMLLRPRPSWPSVWTHPPLACARETVTAASATSLSCSLRWRLYGGRRCSWRRCDWMAATLSLVPRQLQLLLAPPTAVAATGWLPYHPACRRNAVVARQR